MRPVLAFLAILLSAPVAALELDQPFENIDGGTLKISDWAGQPVLVVNTASLCGFTGQYAALQSLYDRYRDQGLVVLAVPSDDFQQELESNAEVKEFCEVQFGLDLPMTGVTPVRGATAHPFYASLADETGFVPKWNFNKVLIGPDGGVVDTFGAPVKPMSRRITNQIETLLN